MVAHHSFSRITLAGAVVDTTLFAHAPSATTALRMAVPLKWSVEPWCCTSLSPVKLAPSQ